MKLLIEHREPITVGFFILQYAKPRLLELFYNFFHKYCNENKFENLEMSADSLYLFIAEGNLKDFILPDKKTQWSGRKIKKTVETTLKLMPSKKIFPRTCCAGHKKHDKRETGLIKEGIRCTELLCLCSKTYYCYDSKSDKFKFNSKRLSKRY